LFSALRLAGVGLLDLVYPPHCLVCERRGVPSLCADCAAHFRPVPGPVCPDCGRPAEPDVGANCRHCERFAPEDGWAFTRARAAAVYQGPVRYAIHLLKYRRAEVLGEPLGAFLANRCFADGLLARDVPVEAVVPVPLHPARLRRRGYNQCTLLAAPVAEMAGAAFLPDALRRSRRTPPQVGLSPGERRRNLASAFGVGDSEGLRGRSVLLVDDVFTTGATVGACAHTLLAAGASRVQVVTLAAGH
jgi:ComF family protein